MPASPLTSVSPVGSFTPDIFASHLATQTSAPAWWLDRKRAAYEEFTGLPLPKRGDESWRFSNIAGITLDGFALHAGAKVDLAPLAIASAASLTFVNNTIMRGAASKSKLPAGVVVTTLADAAVAHAELLRTHFMSQKQRLGSQKFAALHRAFVGDGAFIYVPRGV